MARKRGEGEIVGEAAGRGSVIKGVALAPAIVTATETPNQFALGGSQILRGLTRAFFIALMSILSLAISRDGPTYVMGGILLITILFRNQGIWRDIAWQVAPSAAVVGVLGVAGVVPAYESPDNEWTDGTAGAYWLALVGIALGISWVAFQTSCGVARLLRSVGTAALRINVIAAIHNRMRFQRSILLPLGFLLCLSPAALFSVADLDLAWLDIYGHTPPYAARLGAGVALIVITLGSTSWGAVSGLMKPRETQAGQQSQCAEEHS